jgi:hypothetical protein
MGILQLPTPIVGQSGLLPATKKMVTTDSLSTITAAGYLNAVSLESFPIDKSDILEVLYSYNAVTNVGTFGLFTVSISNGVITLSQWVDAANVLLPVVSGNIAKFNGTTGQIQDASIAASNIMLLSATNTVTGRIILPKVTGTEASNAITLNGSCGVITTSALTTAGAGSYAITWTNSSIATSSVILLTLMGGTNTVKNITLQATAGSGTSTLTIYNNTAVTALDGTIIIGFSVF